MDNKNNNYKMTYNKHPNYKLTLTNEIKFDKI